MTNSGSQATILLLNDEQEIRELLEALLLNEGHRVLPAACNDEALAILRNERVDLLIQDIIRPGGGNGLELYWQLRLDKSLSRIPIMIVSYWPNVEMERLSTAEDGLNNRYRLTFVPDSPIYLDAEAAVKGIENPGVIRVAGYTKTPMESQAFLSMVKEAMDRGLIVKALPDQKIIQKTMAGQLLLVDDELAFLEILGEEFRSRGYSVETAKDGIEALEKIEKGSFKVMITCICMPKLDGIRLSKLVNQRSPGTKVIIFSGSPRATSIEYCEREAVRVDAVFFKGDPWDEFAEAVNRIMTL